MHPASERYLVARTAHGTVVVCSPNDVVIPADEIKWGTRAPFAGFGRFWIQGLAAPLEPRNWRSSGHGAPVRSFSGDSGSSALQ